MKVRLRQRFRLRMTRSPKSASQGPGPAAAEPKRVIADRGDDYGTSENAVKTQIWTAVSVYVLVAIVRKTA